MSCTVQNADSTRLAQKTGLLVSYMPLGLAIDLQNASPQRETRAFCLFTGPRHHRRTVLRQADRFARAKTH